MEENKYYTPEIEEFHVGFTYEFGKDYLGQYLWTEFYIDHADVLSAWELEEQIDDGHVRVKYLDREDIESLGWESVDKNNSGKKFYEGSFENSTRGLMYFEHDWLNNKITIKHPNYFRDGSGRFDGFITIIDGAVIKNKSELRKLMNMLQITK